METTAELKQELALQRLWARRLNGSANIFEEDISELLLDSEAFPPAQVEASAESNNKSRPSSPTCIPFENDLDEDVLSIEVSSERYESDQRVPEIFEERKLIELDGASLGDIPAKYRVPSVRPHEFHAVGVYVDPRVVPGFKYRVRPIQEDRSKVKWLFRGRALELESIGRGYSRRVTFAADIGKLNNNSHYFWTDSSPDGFAFELEVVSPGDKFTVFDANHLSVATLEVLENQMGQEEIDQRVLKDGSIEKSVRVRALCKVEWFQEDDTELVIPMSGVAISVRSKGKSVLTKVIGARLGSHWRRGFTLQPGIDLSQRSTVLRGEAISDVPTRYTIFGLEAHELPVIGTYIDPRIVAGFHYKVCPAGHKRRYMFGGRALRLLNLGQGYGKRITFVPDSLNDPQNYFWSDSYPDGVGFEPSAVRAGMKFGVFDGELKLGEAHVFRADLPQVELNQELEDGVAGKTVVKRIHVEVSCHVGLDVSGAGGKCLEPHDMRVSGTAILAKASNSKEATIRRIENIGLDSQLNVLFFTQLKELVFYPL